MRGDRAMDWEARKPTVLMMVNPADRKERGNTYHGSPSMREPRGSQQKP